MTIDGTVLAFEATDRSGSWSYQCRDGTVVQGDCAGEPAAARLVPALDQAMRELGRPDRLALAHGPGSFTGLRVAVVAARTLAWCDDVPVRAVDSLVAIACAAGPGLWWVLLPLKGDTTFHALIDVAAHGHTVLAETAWCLDAEQPELHARISEATAIGPALASKPTLAANWCPGVQLGPAQACTGLGVLRAAAAYADSDWRALDVAYRIPSAPELQRGKR